MVLVRRLAVSNRICQRLVLRLVRMKGSAAGTLARADTGSSSVNKNVHQRLMREPAASVQRSRLSANSIPCLQKSAFWPKEPHDIAGMIASLIPHGGTNRAC